MTAASLFLKYASLSDPTSLEMEGLASLFDEVGLDPGDVRCLVFLWRLGAESKPGRVSQTEWSAGTRRVGAESLPSLRLLLPSLDPGFMDHDEFRTFFKFAFQFNREGTHRTIEKDVCIALLQLTREGRNNPHLTSFVAFLEASSSPNTARITLDQWTGFLDFSLAVGVDCEGADDNAAWPVLIDEYVEWRAAKGKAEAKK